MLALFLIVFLTTTMFRGMESLTEPPLSLETTIRNERIVGDEYKKLSTLRYTQHSVSNISGDHCMTDCVNNYCLTEKERVESCLVDERKTFTGPTIYYTSNRHGARFCFSKCVLGKQGNVDAYWCYIGTGYEYDYCNPFPNAMLKASIFESNTNIYKNPCKGQCAKQGKNHEWCNLEGGGVADCHPGDLIYYQHINETLGTRQNCVGACGAWDLPKYTGYFCVVKKYNPLPKGQHFTDYCAQAADDFSVCKHCGILDMKRKMSLEEYIKNLENNNNNTKIIVNDSSTSIISYTYKEVRDGLRLPLVVKALILPKHINVHNSHFIQNNIDEEAKENCEQITKNVSDCSSYVFGNLVSHRHGGTGAFYNVAPLAKHLNFGTKKGDLITPSIWIINERKITNYVYEFKGVVEQTIALYYSGKSHTPKAIGSFTRVLDRAVSSTLWQCENIHSNDPKYGRECDSF